jgi:hypothetical protein
MSLTNKPSMVGYLRYRKFPIGDNLSATNLTQCNEFLIFFLPQRHRGHRDFFLFAHRETAMGKKYNVFGYNGIS